MCISALRRWATTESHSRQWDDDDGGYVDDDDDGDGDDGGGGDADHHHDDKTEWSDHHSPFDLCEEEGKDIANILHRR